MLQHLKYHTSSSLTACSQREHCQLLILLHPLCATALLRRAHWSCHALRLCHAHLLPHGVPTTPCLISWRPGWGLNQRPLRPEAVLLQLSYRISHPTYFVSYFSVLFFVSSYWKTCKRWDSNPWSLTSETVTLTTVPPEDENNICLLDFCLRKDRPNVALSLSSSRVSFITKLKPWVKPNTNAAHNKPQRSLGVLCNGRELWH